MHAVFCQVQWLLEWFVLFLGLTIYGAMWRGAQDHGRKGWLIALIWSVVILLLWHAIEAAHQLLHWGPPPAA